MLRRRRGEFRGVWERGWEFGNKFGGLGTSLGVWGEDAIACNIYAVNFDFKNKFGKKLQNGRVISSACSAICPVACKPVL